MTLKFIATATLLGLSTLTTVAVAQEAGRVISSTPLFQQIGVPRQVCNNQPVAVNEPKSGAGALMGALAGGGLGHAVGQGGGKVLATLAGVMGGAILGNNIEGGHTSVQNVQQCSTQTFYENRTVGYNVVYEYQGKQYAVQMPNDPGPAVQLQVTPVGAMNGPTAPGMALQPGYAPPSYPQPGVNQPMTYVLPDMQPAMTTSTTYVIPAGYPPSYYAPPAVYPSYYGGGYYPPVGVSLGFGYRGGYYGGGRHWR